LLLLVNRIWKQRVGERMTEVKRSHEAEVRALRRQLAQRVPYESVVQKAQIVRLQRNLYKSRQTQLKALKDDKSGSLLDLTLATVENLSKQLLEADNNQTALRAQIEGLGTQHQHLQQPPQPVLCVWATLTNLPSLLRVRMLVQRRS
jgi:hypothetical protein